MTAVALDVSVQKFETLEDLVVEINGEYATKQDIWEQLEKENPDFSFYQDVHLSALLDTLIENGLTEEQILTFSLALYGPVIDFYQVGSGENELFVMAVGQR